MGQVHLYDAAFSLQTHMSQAVRVPRAGRDSVSDRACKSET